MKKLRTDRLNSLLKDVILEVIKKNVRNPKVNELTTVTNVDITRDLHYAKVYISTIGTDKEKRETIKALQSGAGFIAIHASKKITIRHFPSLTFYIDETIEKQMHIQNVIKKIQDERKQRPTSSSESSDSSDASDNSDVSDASDSSNSSNSSESSDTQAS